MNRIVPDLEEVAKMKQMDPAAGYYYSPLKTERIYHPRIQVYSLAQRYSCWNK
jgi:hypothetical protein